jgi:hypothetical protein
MTRCPEQKPKRERLGTLVKFVPPPVVAVNVYGLLRQ